MNNMYELSLILFAAYCTILTAWLGTITLNINSLSRRMDDLYEKINKIYMEMIDLMKK